VNGEGGLIKVALELEPGIADELRVVRIQAGYVLEQPGGAQRPQVEIDVGVSGWKQAGGLRRTSAERQQRNRGGRDRQQNHDKYEVAPAHVNLFVI
jgi:hypothetical protein